MIYPRDIKQLLESCYEYRSEIVPCLIGAPGIGKTQAIEEFAEEKGVNLVTLIVSQMLPNEVSGITMPVDETHSMDIYDHARLSSLKDGDILFFDELFEGSEQTMSACLTLIQSRVMMSGKHLPDIMIVAATNPTLKPARLKPSVRDRFKFFEVRFDWESYRSYIATRYGAKLVPELAKKLETDSNSFNILTPRTLAKLIGWYQTASDKKQVARYIEDVTDAITASLIKQSVDGKSHELRDRRMLLETLKDAGWKSLADEFEDDALTIEEIVNRLKARDDWRKIEAKLASVTVEEFKI